jgi:hypothetical protein
MYTFLAQASDKTGWNNPLFLLCCAVFILWMMSMQKQGKI